MKHFLKFHFKNITVVLTIAVLSTGLIFSSYSKEVVDKTLRKTLLEENWKKVLTLLDTVTIEIPSPVLRMIKGHAK